VDRQQPERTFFLVVYPRVSVFTLINVNTFIDYSFFVCALISAFTKLRKMCLLF